ncbi:RHS repeat domain-containing protein [Chryseobacterium sp. CKR4-1]|uniref:RHS repeat domain-containing protein n=1 Tax=Chryseobacterium sp. CKR4-1 TaxID=3068896 RepID=UPI0027968B20|nr:RHS repeat domain-containing protein [Chryseobacterium sp. CKR4-1]MDQ1803093.1 RHS repeat domain-containing protein [Chryseobacterium sp. CKR4-1]
MRKNNFIKNLFSFCFLVHSIINYAQSVNTFELQKSNYETMGTVDIARGNPSIGVPLFSVPTQSSKLKINLGLNYSASDISSMQMISSIAMGWNISGGAYVSRSSHNYVKEYEAAKIGDNKIYNSNMFQYSCPGGSGRFAIAYDKNTNGPKIIQTETSKTRIIFEKTTDTTKYLIKSFTVIDENGLKYLFDKNDISFYGIGNKKELFQSAYNLTQIRDEGNNTIATYDYVPYTQSISDYRGTQYITTYKLLKINITNIGSIDFQYYQGSTPLPVTNWTPGSSDFDRYTLQKVMLKDVGSRVIQQYQLDRNDNQLIALIKQDKNNNLIEKYSFDYNIDYNVTKKDQYGFGTVSSYQIFEQDRLYDTKSVNPQYAYNGALRAIHLPSGGKIEYEFESNTLPVASYQYSLSYSGGNILNHPFKDFKLVKIAEINFDMAITKDYPFTIDSSIYTNVCYIIGGVNDLQLKGPTVPFSYKIYNAAGTEIIRTPFQNATESSSYEYFVTNGTNKLRLTGSSPDKGTFIIYGVKKLSEPFNYTKGLRVKSIKKYDDPTAAPIEVLDYNYDDFSKPGVPNSMLYSWDNSNMLIDGGFYQPFEEMLYKNVRVTNTTKNYFTKYSFITPNDANSLFNLPFQSPFNYADLNYNILNMLLPQKIEQYKGNGELVQKNEYQYTINYTPVDANIPVPPKIPWIETQTVNGFSYPDANTVLTNSSTTTAEGKYGNIIKEAATDETGDYSEKNYKYADDLNNQKLKNVNLIAVPLQSETNVTQDGISKNISKSEVKFDRTTDAYPSSTISYDVVSGTPSTEGTFDQYDAFGNVLQLTSKSGVPVSLVYGYNNTLLIAKVEGITYDQLTALNIIQPIINASLNDISDPSTEPAFITAFDTFRKNQNLKQYNITTYTYDPLIGVTTETSPAGVRKNYQYDNANRLIKITDRTGNTLQEFKNNLKNQ